MKEQKLEVLQKLVLHIENHYGPRSEEACSVQKQLSGAYIELERYREALEVIDKFMPFLRESTHKNDSDSLELATCLSTKGICHSKAHCDFEA